MLMFICLAWWNPRFLGSSLASVSQFVLYPLERIFSYVAFEVRDFFSLLDSIGELKTENEHLIQENLDLRSEVATLQEIRQENESLRKSFDVAFRNQYTSVAAEVLAFDELAQGKSLIINQGSGTGITQGMPVIVGKGILIGKVVDVFIGSARVELLSNAQSTVAAMTSEGGARGIVRGEHSLGLLLDMVPRTDVFKRGESIVTSGLGGEFPRGLLIGTVQDPEATVDKLFQQAPIIPPIKYSNVRFVSVILMEKI